MKFTGKIIRLPSGAEIVLRQADEADASAMIELIRNYVDTSDHLVLTRDEVPGDLSEERKWIRKFIEDRDSLLIVAVHEGALIGNLDLTAGGRRKLAHTALLGMSVHSAWRGQGIGKILMDAALKWAGENPRLELVWLQVLADNEVAMKLYEAAGFVVCGTQKGFIKNGPGDYRDNVIMQRKVSP